ncbi:hypothetical protein K7432_000326 [Basidiobolus ranarum]|uniref:PWWP domain-containing protein n=1 Tax=Basidiobolus ranarum TaxID=34480 RepID=A0ABR2WBB7_9FUNG
MNMETHTLSTTLLPDATFSSEKYSENRFQPTEEKLIVKDTKEHEEKGINSPSLSDTNIKIETNHSTESNSTSRIDKQKQATRFEGREVVFVDPLDESAEYWWPAMIVPPTEIDRSMLSRKLEQDECLVRYFEDNKFSVCKDKELTLFQPGKDPFNEFSHHESFVNDPGVLIALKYLQTGELGKKFMWKLWGKDKNIPPIAAQPSTPSSDPENPPRDTTPDPQTPQQKHSREQPRSSSRKRKKVHDDSEINTGQSHSPTSANTDKGKHPSASPVLSRAPSTDSSSIVTHETAPDSKSRLRRMTPKWISKRMKTLRKEYRKIRRGVSRIAKELVVHKAGDGRITRSMRRRKR